jgi:tetratricopeptide (TPR) repeat protein
VTAAAAIVALLLCVSADSYYDRGMALARQERWDEAKSEFELGRDQYPQDRRFTLELAGIAFKQQRYSDAKRNLRHALSSDPTDRYANDFLATLYQLEENTEAALKYWNRIGKPKIEDVRMEPPPEVNRVLLDRAFAFAPASVLDLSDLMTTEARLDFLDIFPRYRLDLVARPDGAFDVLFRSTQRSHWGALIALLSGAPFQSITPQFSNLGRSGANVTSLLRWDKQKRRALLALSGPIARNASLGYRLYVDGRNENWIIHGLNLKKIAAGAEMRARVGGRWGWSSGFEVARREFLNVPIDDSLYRDGMSLKYRGTVEAWLVRAPERRFTLQGEASWESGRTFGRTSHEFARMSGSLHAQWFPQSRGESYEVNAHFRAGRIFGQAPFDELYKLGLERDNDLPMRAHIGTRDGKKGSAPLGRKYGLLNWEADRVVHDNGFLKIRLGPFVDTGGVGSRWLWDVGVQCKVTVFGVGVALSYGKDLRSGASAYYATGAR